MDKPRLVIAGAGGVVGRHLVALAKDRYLVTALTRSRDGGTPAGATPVVWNPRAVKDNDRAALDTVSAVLSGAAALVNLAGASIDEGRLDAAHRQRVLESRVDSTNTLVTALTRATTPPPALFSASAVGYYGDRGDEVLTEASGPQDSFFLSRVCQAWESAAQAAETHTRLTIGRFGLVLAKAAPAWLKYLLPIRLFIGGPLGNGRQWYAWIDADDLARAILLLLEREDCRGVYNLTTPEPVRQLELTRLAAARLSRPAFVPAPAPALRLLLGGLADTLLLPSARALPMRLEAIGFAWDQPHIGEELAKLLG